MIRDIYLDRDEFELKFHPKRPKNGRLIELNHPEAFINDKVKRHSYPVNFQRNVPGMVSFECNLLLTNPAHDGIWLFMDNDNDRIMIPGGYIQEEDWEYAHKNPYYVIYSTLVRTMRDIHPLFRDTAAVDPILTFIRNPSLSELKDLLVYVVRQNRFQINNPVKPHLFYYQYWLSKSDDRQYIPLESMKIYLLLEISEPVETSNKSKSTLLFSSTTIWRGKFIFFKSRTK